MKRLLTLGIAAVSAAALAACGSAASMSAPAPAGNTGGDTVSAQAIGNAGKVLVDSSGQALYASDLEANGKVMCTGACNSLWMPLTVNGPIKAAGSLNGKLGMVRRPDGARQVTFEHMPLYSFIQEQPGQVTGDGFTDAFDGHTFTWSVVTPNGRASAGSQGSQGGASTQGAQDGAATGGAFSY